VVEFGKRRPKIAIAGCTDAQTEIDVVEGNSEICFIKAADLFKNLATDHRHAPVTAL